jgi:hypothetical protein
MKSASGAPGVVLVGGLTGAAGVTVRGDDVLFTDETRVLSVPKTGGPLSVIAFGESLPMVVVADADAIYWLNRGEGMVAGVLMRSGSDGNLSTLIDEIDTPSDLAIDDTSVYFAAAAATVNGESVEGPLVRVAKATGAADVLVKGIQEPGGITVDALDVYWIDQLAGGPAPGQVLTMPKAGGTVVTVLETAASTPIRVSVDATYAYVTGITDPAAIGFLGRVPRQGGMPKALDQTPNTGYGAVANDASAIYFTVGWSAGNVPPGTASVVRICK